MSVKRFDIRIPQSSATTATTINIPINLEFQMVDQADIIEREFVEVELEKAVNPIVDYEKGRFLPVDSNDNQLEEVRYCVHFLASTTFPTVSYYGDIGFVYDDLKFRKNRFTRSFLRLNFYDSDIPTNQRLVSTMTLFPRITNNEIIPIGQPNAGLPLPETQIPVRFSLTDPISNPQGFAEGYHIYHFKDEVLSTLPLELYMRADYNNANDGVTTPLMTDSIPYSIDDLIGRLHTKYILRRTNDGYVYEIDTSAGNVNITSTSAVVDLFQIQAL